MENMIKEIWYGNIVPQENGIFKLRELLNFAAQHRSKLEEGLNEEQKEVLDKMMGNRDEYDSLAEAAVFEYGFRLGTRIMLEMMRN